MLHIHKFAGESTVASHKIADYSITDNSRAESLELSGQHCAHTVEANPGDTGVRNAAPYSFFKMMGAEPPLVAIGLMRRPDGSYKDSTQNIIDTEEFVINLVAEPDAVVMNFTCIDAPPEFGELGPIDIQP